MLKYVPFPLWSAGPRRLLFVPRWLVSASWFAPSPTRALIMCDSARGKAGRGWNERKGREEACCTEIGLLLLLISWKNQLMLFCALFLLTQREVGGGRWVFGQLPMAWQLEFEFSTLCHYYTPPFPYFLPHTGKKMCIHTHHPLPLKCICRPWCYGIGLSARY